MKKNEFDDLVNQGYTHIPVYRQVLADFDTPLSIYLKLADQPYSYLLESAAQGGEQWSRYSIIGLPAKTILRVVGQRLTVEENGKVVEVIETEDPLGEIEKHQRKFKVASSEKLGRFYGGLAGYFGYDTVRFVERKLRDSCPPDNVHTPDILLMESRNLVVFDNVAGSIQFITLADALDEHGWEHAQRELDELEAQLTGSLPRFSTPYSNLSFSEDDFESAFGEE